MPISPEPADFSTRRDVSLEAKQRLGAKAASLVGPGQMIFLDGGTTTAEIARHLPRSFGMTVVTHSPTIAAELEHHPTADVVLIGGRLYKHSMVATGAATMAAVSRLRPDIFFLGVTAAHPVHGLSTGDFEEAAIKRHIARVFGRNLRADDGGETGSRIVPLVPVDCRSIRTDRACRGRGGTAGALSQPQCRDPRSMNGARKRAPS